MLDLKIFSHTLCDGSNVAARIQCESRGFARGDCISFTRAGKLCFNDFSVCELTSLRWFEAGAFACRIYVGKNNPSAATCLLN